MSGQTDPLASQRVLDAFREAAEWFPKGNCHKMGEAFTEATHEEQIAVCNGTNAPWMKICPVIEQCRADVLVRADLLGIEEINAGNLVAGGLTPAEQRKMIRRNVRAAKKREKDEKENSGS